MITINEEDFGILCICALRYCQGRMTYMPDLVRGIVKPFLPTLPNKAIGVMVQDCDFQRRMNLYGNDRIDKPGWLEWEKIVKEEEEKRWNNGQNRY